MNKKIVFSLIVIALSFITIGGNSNNKEVTFNTVDTEAVKVTRDDNNTVLVDTRINDAFNGWKLDGVTRGGHIEGAVDFSANWLKADISNKEALLDEALQKKGITKEKSIILYDSNETDAKEVANYLSKKDYKNISLYQLKPWTEDETLPMISYPHYEKIMPAVAIKDLLDGKEVETFSPGKAIKIIEASWGEATKSYDQGHLPTAIHINTDSIEPPPEWLLANDEELKTFALDYGFTKDDIVIVTGADQMAAYRVAVVLQYIGVFSDVRVLNGGTSAWTMAGYDLDTETYTPTPVADFGETIPGNPDLIDTIDEVKAGLTTPDTFTLVDNRTWDEHIGNISGYSYHDKMGRISGSVFGFAGKEGANSLDYYVNPDGTMRNQDEIKNMLTEAGIGLNKHLSFMCGSGWRVSQILTYAKVMGLDNTSIYSDGWIGWSSNPNNPIITGMEGLDYAP